MSRWSLCRGLKWSLLFISRLYESLQHEKVSLPKGVILLEAPELVGRFIACSDVLKSLNPSPYGDHIPVTRD